MAIFNAGDRVMVNRGANGTTKGEVYLSENDKSIFVMLEDGRRGVFDPWDVFHIEEETE